MSLSALMVATRDLLKTALELNDAQCRIMPDERAIPSSGQEFISIFGDSWIPLDQDLDMGIDETYGITCAVTRKIGFSPGDRTGVNVYVEISDSLERRIRQLIKLIHKNYKILIDANTILAINDENVHKIIEPFRWKGCDPSPKMVGPSHFYLPEDDVAAPTGFVMSATFGDARRLQSLDNFDIGE